MAARSTRRGGRKAAPARNASPKDAAGKVPPTRATSDATATGMQIQHESGEQHIPSGKEAGSQVPIVGGDPTPDVEGPQKPRGDQAKPALFVSNGSIERGTVASPSGPVPVAAVATSPEHAEDLIKKHEEAHARYVNRTTRHPRLDDNTVNRLGRAELRAIADQRGYDMPEIGGNRTTRAAFLKAQDADKSLKEAAT